MARRVLSGLRSLAVAVQNDARDGDAKRNGSRRGTDDENTNVGLLLGAVMRALDHRVW
jgi:hypothetical protein